jgi:primosomal replication protein N
MNIIFALEQTLSVTTDNDVFLNKKIQRIFLNRKSMAFINHIKICIRYKHKQNENGGII